MDSPLNPHRSYVPFDGKIPLCGIDPDDDTDLCFVSFNAAWKPYILGALSALTRVEIWDDSDYDLRNQEALRAHLLLDRFMTCESGDTLQLRACDCGIEWSNDGETWTCINLTPCIADIVTTGILDSINNGIIDAPGYVPTDFTPPEAGYCKTFHVQMSAAQAYVLPLQVSAGDTVEVTNLKGAWSDGDLTEGFYYGWACPDGKTYYLGSCALPWVTQESDPFQDANHLELILQYADQHALPARGLITIPGNIYSVDCMFVPNYDRVPLGFGTVEFDVTVCRGNAWAYSWNFEDGLDFWGIEQGTWIEGTGVQTTNATYTEARVGVDISHIAHITHLELDYEIVSEGTYSGNDAILAYLSVGGNLNPGSSPGSVGTHTMTWNGNSAMDDDESMHLRALVGWPTTGGQAILKAVRMIGSGTCPFEHCS